jgi:hypothetical protein
MNLLDLTQVHKESSDKYYLLGCYALKSGSLKEHIVAIVMVEL